jgi:hypothetical protein
MFMRPLDLPLNKPERYYHLLAIFEPFWPSIQGLQVTFNLTYQTYTLSFFRVKLKAKK